MTDPVLHLPLIRVAALHASVPNVRTRVWKLGRHYNVTPAAWADYEHEIALSAQLGVHWAHDGNPVKWEEDVQVEWPLVHFQISPEH